MKFGEKIVRLRKIKGITQDEFANAVGVSRQAVYKWESGQSYPEVTKLIEIKMLFEISIDDLLDENYEVALPEKKHKARKAAPVVKKEEITPEKEEKSEVYSTENLKEETALPAEQITEIKADLPKDNSINQEEEKKEEDSTEKIIDEPVLVNEQEEKKEENQNDESSRKVSFFGRIFGRK